jgi:hypothetical protein
VHPIKSCQLLKSKGGRPLKGAGQRSSHLEKYCFIKIANLVPTLRLSTTAVQTIRLLIKTNMPVESTMLSSAMIRAWLSDTSAITNLKPLLQGEGEECISCCVGGLGAAV